MKRNNELQVIVVEQEPRVDSKPMADRLGIQHRSFVKMIEKYQVEMEEFGKIAFQMLPSGSGQPEKHVQLNEDQSIFALTLSRNTDQVVDLKKELTKKFRAYYRAYLKEARQAERRASIDYQQARAEGKLARRSETDHIKSFVSYTESQGSKNAFRYYTTITKMTYKTLGFIEKVLPSEPIREIIDRIGLANLATAEYLVAETLDQGMKDGKFYKDIFQDCKGKLIQFADIVGKRPLLTA